VDEGVVLEVVPVGDTGVVDEPIVLVVLLELELLDAVPSEYWDTSHVPSQVQVESRV